jgi:hypothetical protein
MTDPRVDFSSFVVSLATGAAGALDELAALESGKMTGPDGEQKDVSPEEAKQHKDAALIAARQLIDTLAMLEEKTTGNLSDAEQQVLRGSLANLRIRFVKVATPAN